MKPGHLLPLFALFFHSIHADRQSLYGANGEFLPHVRLAKDLVDKRNYDPRVRPVLNHSEPTKIVFSMSLYQILGINEKAQSVDLNLWVIQKWKDEFLGWNPHRYGMINTTILPYQSLWLPDTYLYNSVVMNREETERYINLIVTTRYWGRERGALVKFMHPALYRSSCRINIRYFPYDQQNCTLVISSWTSDKGSLDYWPEFDAVNLENFIPNEEWVVVSFRIHRVEESFVCCPDPWVLLHASLVVRRKPLYYIVNLVVPTSVITLVAVTGFFTPASTSGERREKLSLGIDSLLAMSILMMMVGEQMPTTSDYIPLFGIFYLSIIFIIFIGTLFTAFILNIHLQKVYNRPISPLISYIFFHKVAPFLRVRPSTALLELWAATGVRIKGLDGSRIPTLRKSMGQSPRRRVGKSRRKKSWLPTMSSFHPDRGGLASESINEKSEAVVMENLSAVRAMSAKNNWKRIARRASQRRRTEIALGVDILSPLEPVIESATTSSSSAETAGRLGHHPPKALHMTTSQLSASSDIPFADASLTSTRRSSPHQIGGISPLTAQLTPIRLNLPSLQSPPPRPPSPPSSIEQRARALLRPGRISIMDDGLPPRPPRQPRSSFGWGEARISTLCRSPNLPIRAPSITPCLSSQARSPVYKFPGFGSTAAQISGAMGFGGGGGGGDSSGADAAMLEQKLRRRYAQEWEFLATVLDRLLLIVFAGLVALVTGLVLVLGELIRFSYESE